MSHDCFQFGPTGDVKLFRSGADTLVIDAAVKIAGALHASDIKVDGVAIMEIVHTYVDEKLKGLTIKPCKCD